MPSSSTPKPSASLIIHLKGQRVSSREIESIIKWAEKTPAVLESFPVDIRRVPGITHTHADKIMGLPARLER